MYFESRIKNTDIEYPKGLVYLWLMISLMMLSCTSRQVNKNISSHTEDSVKVSDSYNLHIVSNTEADKNKEMDSCQIQTNTWGVHFEGNTMFGDKDNKVNLPNIQGLYTAKRWSYCKIMSFSLTSN